MLAIRPEQLAVLSQAQVKRFEDWMLAHLKTFFPKESELAGELELREKIQYGIKQASTYRITSERDVCKYIDLMMVLGRDFDRDKKLPWAAEILGTRNSPSVKTVVLVETAKKNLPGK
jgi:hypothetical protein